VVHGGEGKLGADGEAEVFEILVIELLVVVDREFGRYSEAANNILVMVDTALASIHLVKYSTATKVNLRFP
jgi:hypothetical protein